MYYQAISVSSMAKAITLECDNIPENIQASIRDAEEKNPEEF